MRKRLFLLLLSSLFILITACSSSNSQEKAKMEDSAGSANFSLQSEMSQMAEVENVESVQEAADEATSENTSTRMIIHQAYLQINVNDSEKTQHEIEKKAKEYGGYTVESNVYRENEKASSGRIVVRVPEKHFQQFLVDTEGKATEILERNVTGQDVTEEYVDLESRLKSKKVVEKRLLEFMEKADKTEDLLKISNDLSKIQEEIEVIVGKMKFLDNQIDFSMIEINMYDNQVIIPDIDNKNLNTWEKTKKQLATSTNLIISAVSGLIVFIIGNLPILIIILLISLGIFFVVKRRNKHK